MKWKILNFKWNSNKKIKNKKTQMTKNIYYKVTKLSRQDSQCTLTFLFTGLFTENLITDRIKKKPTRAILRFTLPHHTHPLSHPLASHCRPTSSVDTARERSQRQTTDTRHTHHIRSTWPLNSTKETSGWCVSNKLDSLHSKHQRVFKKPLVLHIPTNQDLQYMSSSYQIRSYQKLFNYVFFFYLKSINRAQKVVFF